MTGATVQEASAGGRGEAARPALPLWSRLLILTSLGLASLVGSSMFFSSALNRTSERTARMSELIEVAETASEVQVAFGDMRYWLTDLAVSLLVVSERNADAANERLEEFLGQLSGYDDDTVAAIRDEVAAFRDDAMAAVEAYTDENRVIGNTLLAQARTHSASVDAALTALRRDVSAAAADERERVMVRAKGFARTALYLVLALAALGLALTVLVVRSIVRPLRDINEAVAALGQRRYDVALPPERGDEFGAIARTLRLFRDTALERERLEAEAEAQRARIATAIETIPDGFVLFDADERVLVANSKYQEIFPETAGLVAPGVAFRDLLAVQARLAVRERPGRSEAGWIEERMALHRSPAGFAEDQRHGDRWLRITKRRMPGGGVVAVYADITLLKARQEELEVARRQAVEASEAKSRFLASMSHELRTPLNAIIGYSEMLIEEAGDRGAGNLVDDLEKVAGSGRHLLGLINDVLDLSKIEAGKMEVHVEEFDVAEMLRDVQATISPLVQRNGNLLEMRLGGPLGAMRSDQMKIRQNLLNLLSNAAKFTENGRITLDVQRTAREGSDWLVFELSDTGIGMTEEQAGRLFAAFTQADSSTTRLYGGTGLGLSITRSFSRAVGGDITLRSSPGEGSTFTMSLPAEIERVGGEAVEAPVDGEYVLIIDDEAAARRTMADALTQVGYASREAAGGPEGIAVARVSRPLAIVLDVLMPHQDGWSVLRELKADAELSDIPVILATVLADRELGMALGAVEYLVKPIDSGALIATLKTLGAERGDVLVIDDDEASRGFLRRVLVRQGMGVREAGDGERGLDEMRRARPDLVLLDIIMPRLDGFAVLRAMQAAPDLCDIPVIVVTSKDLDAGERATLREGAAAVVTKGGETRGALVEALRRQVGQAAAQERGT